MNLEHFTAHIFPYHFLSFLSQKFGKCDGSQGWHLLVVRTGNVIILCTSRAVETVFLLVHVTYFWNYNFFGWGMDLKDMAILVKQLLLKVWHNGKVYHSLECCFSSAFKLLFKVAATTSQVERAGNNTVSVHSGIEPTLCSSLSCLTCLCLLKEPDV